MWVLGLPQCQNCQQFKNWHVQICIGIHITQLILLWRMPSRLSCRLATRKSQEFGLSLLWESVELFHCLMVTLRDLLKLLENMADLLSLIKCKLGSVESVRTGGDSNIMESSLTLLLLLKLWLMDTLLLQ